MDLKQAQDEIAKLREEYQATLKKYLRDASQDFFNKHTDILGFTWRQYTPYWCDGDPCHFRRGEDYDGIFMEDGEEFAEELGSEINDEIYVFMSIFTDDDLETMFGDHARVTIRRDQNEAVVTSYEDHH